MRKYYAEITALIAIGSMLTIIILALIYPSKSKLASDAMDDGRWAEFEKCIEYHPSDFVCDSCWTAIIEQKSFNK